MSLKSIIANHRFNFVKERERFVFREVERKDRDEALKMVKYFWTDAFVHKCMRVGAEEADILAKYYVDTYFLNGLTIGVFEKTTGKLVCLAMSSLHDFKDERVDRVPKEHTFRNLQLATERDFFIKMRTTSGKIFEYVFGLVYPEWGNYRIFTEVSLMSVGLARLHGCTHMGGICSSLYTFKICIKFGHVCGKKIRVGEFRDAETGAKFEGLNPEHEYFYWVYLELKDSKL